MQKEIKVGEKTFIVREMLAVDTDDIDWNNRGDAIKKQVIISTGISEDEYKLLSVKERLVIVQTINEINGFNDFQNPVKQ